MVLGAFAADKRPTVIFVEHHHAVVKVEWTEKLHERRLFFPPFGKHTMKRPNVSEYHLHIKLKDTSVKIWRELKVPPNLELDFLEHPLINIMGWEVAHLFYYMHNKIFYSDEVNLLEQDLRTEQL